MNRLERICREGLRRSAVLLALLLLLPACFFSARGEAITGSEEAVTALLESLAEFRMRQSGAGDVQAWVDGELRDSVDGNGGWYLQALSQGGRAFDASSCRAALEAAAEQEVRSLTKRLRMALTLQALGSASPLIARAVGDAGQDGSLMPVIFCLHLMNNGAEAEGPTRTSVMERLLALQLEDGGWAVIGSSCDVDCTAMALQALAPLVHGEERAAAAAERGLQALSAVQLDNGGFAGMGRESSESCAQVVLALSSLGLDCGKDPRFLKGGLSPLDALLRFRTEDGGFAHDPESGESNETATLQAFCALTGYRRMLRGQGPYYVFDRREELSGAAGTEEKTEKMTEAAPSENPSGVAGTEKKAERTTEAAGTEPAPAAKEALPRWILYAVIGGAALLLCLLAWWQQRRSWRTFVFILAAAALLALGASMLRIESPEGYYAGAGQGTGEGIPTTVSIRCDPVAGRNEYAPEDGVILPETEVRLQPGATALDQLLEVTRAHRIQMEYDGTAAGAYVRGIAYLYEMDFGNLSGWMFRVNGAFADVGASQYILAENDRVEWIYSTRIGKDVE